MRRRAFLQLSAGTVGAGFLRGVPAEQPRTHTKAKVVIVGGGFAGSSCALALRRLSPGTDVTLVDPDDRYVTCPMSNSVLVGLRNLASITVLRDGLAGAGVNYVRGRIASVDTRQRRAKLAGGGVLAYDRLIMALGIRFLWDNPRGYDLAAAGLMPHAWQAGAQTEILAAQLRAMPDGGVFAISVPPGPMRCPPGPFERASLVAEYLQQNKPRSKVLIFDSNNRFPRQDIFTDAWNSLYPKMIEWIPVVEDGAVVRVEPAAKLVYTSHGAHRVDVANIIPPQAPGLLAARTGLAADHGWCPVRPDTFESSSVAHVHVIGDACIADPMPKAASAAISQAKQCALAIAAALEGREPPAAAFDSVCYSMVGRGSALSIRARFRFNGAAIEQLPAAEDVLAPPSAQVAQNAQDWYAGSVSDAFGT
jgi:sulfide dehydrogenase [flavocytochrome c] flavoprotein subunit